MSVRSAFSIMLYIEAAAKTHPHSIVRQVFEDCQIKLMAGEEKYGSPLQTHNGRDADLDAYQDILDAINYQTQGLMEAIENTDAWDRSVDIENTVHIAVHIRQRLVKKGVLDE